MSRTPIKAIVELELLMLKRRNALASTADDKARFVATAMPLLERVPEGAYRKLLFARLAETIDMTEERFRQICGVV